VIVTEGQTGEQVGLRLASTHVLALSRSISLTRVNRLTCATGWHAPDHSSQRWKLLKAPEVYQKIGVNFANVIILPAAQEVLKANTALHIANEILR